MESVTIASLPKELLCSIMASLPIADLKNARLVNHGLSRAGSTIIFRTVTVTDTPSSLSKLQHILKKEHFAIQVRHIKWAPFGHRKATDIKAIPLSKQVEWISKFPRISTVSFSGGLDRHTLSPHTKLDFFAAVSQLLVKPEFVEVAGIRFQVAYKNRIVEALHATGIFDQEPQEVKQIQHIRWMYDEYHTLYEVLGSMRHIERGFDSLVNSQDTLRVVHLQGCEIRATFVASLLKVHTELQELDLIDVCLFNDPEEYDDTFDNIMYQCPVLIVLRAVVLRKGRSVCAEVNVNLTRISKANWTGSFSATSSELSEWCSTTSQLVSSDIEQNEMVASRLSVFRPDSRYMMTIDGDRGYSFDIATETSILRYQKIGMLEDFSRYSASYPRPLYYFRPVSRHPSPGSHDFDETDGPYFGAIVPFVNGHWSHGSSVYALGTYQA